MPTRRCWLAAAIAVAGVTWGLPAGATAMPQGLFLEAPGATVAVILAHGQGLGPDSQVVGPLRRGIQRELGWHTLSLQMPVLPGTASRTWQRGLAYVPTFPDAFARIQQAIDWLREVHGVRRIYLMGYSMGARMTTAFLAEHPQPGVVVGYVGVGLVAGGPEPLNTNLSLRRIDLPLLDVYAEDDFDAQFAAARRGFLGARLTQVAVPGAKHDYRGHDDEVLRAVVDWLRRQERL